MTEFADPKTVALIDRVYKESVNEFVIVTGSSANYVQVFEINLLWSIKEYLLNNPKFPFNLRVIFYDLDTDPELHVKNEEMLKSYPFVEYRKFDYPSYPDFFDVNIAMGEYAFKGVIIEEVVREQRTKVQSGIIKSDGPSFVYWLDAGIRITATCDPPLSKEIPHALETGITTPLSQGALHEFTDKRTALYLGLPEEVYMKHEIRTCSAGIVLIDANNDGVYEAIVKPWAECSKIKDCIAPEGSFKRIYNEPRGTGFKEGGHRQDQSVLSVLLARDGRPITRWTGCYKRGRG